MSDLLKFSNGNSKLSKNTQIISLPAGHACPAAKYCKSCADRKTGKVTDGPHCKYRCFGATSEARSPNLRKNSWHNFELLKAAGTREAMATLIDRSIPDYGGLFRIHSTGGDFFNKEYLQAWCDVAASHPGRVDWMDGKPYVVGSIFYAYTKTLNIIPDVTIPDNLRLTASAGGKYDHLIPTCGLKSVTVVFSEEEAARLDLAIDHDDTHAWAGTADFALIIHGTQPKGSEAAEALKANRAAGKFAGYNKNKKTVLS